MCAQLQANEQRQAEQSGADQCRPEIKMMSIRPPNRAARITPNHRKEVSADQRTFLDTKLSCALDADSLNKIKISMRILGIETHKSVGIRPKECGGLADMLARELK